MATVHNVSVTSNAYTPSSLTIAQGDTVVWSNMSGSHNVNGSTTTYPNNPVGFSNGAASSSMWTYQFVFNTPGTYSYQCDPHTSLGMTGSITVQSGIPSYDIAQVTGSDSLGVADSLTVECKLTGVLHSIDFDGNSGYSFYMYDATGGINVFNFSDVSSYSSPQVGDSIRVVGTIDQYNGLTEIVPDSISVLGSGVALKAPTAVTSLGESTEGEYITFRGARLINASNWPSAGNSGNVDVTTGQDTITLRIDSDSDIDGTTAPTGVFNVTGAGGQYDFSSPYTEGYQLFPSSVNDIDTVPPSSLPYYDIASVTTNDANFAPDSLGVNCELRGTVYTVDFDGNSGISLYMYDQTGGINVFNFSDPDFYSQVQPGDSIHVFGDIDQYRGLTEIFADSIVLFGRGQSLQAPTVVSTLDETTEGEYVELQGLSLVNASQWPSAGNSATVDVTNGTDTLALRIDSDTDIDGTPAPTTAFDVEGAGSQFTFSSTPNNGYQLYPSSLNSFTFTGGASTPCTQPFFSEYIEGSSNNKGFEIYNPDSQALNLGGYQVVLSGNGGSFTNTFDLSGTLASGDVYTITTDQADPTMLAAADTALSFPSIAHFNGDDALVLLDTTTGDTLDIIGVVGVDPGSSWSVGSGSTQNHTLVRNASVSQGEKDWSIASGQWSVNPSNTFSFLGSHTSNCVAAPANPTVNFATSQTSVLESAGTVQVDMLINPTSSTQDTITLQASLGSNVTTGDGTITPSPNLLTGLFDVVVPANADSASFTINVIDDALLEGNETLFVDIDTASSNLMVGNNRNFAFIIQDNDFPTYSIAQVTTNQPNGEPDSLNVYCKVGGTVFSPNFQGGGLSIYMSDGTGGINVFSFNAVSGYTPALGDSIVAIGNIAFYNGLTEIIVDSVRLVSSGNPIPTPTPVTDLNEGTESELIRLNGYRLVDPTQWPLQGSNRNLDITNGQDTLLMRIDRDTDIDGSTAPTGNFDLIGVGSQFDGSDPYDEGYQIFPRDTNDILPVNLPNLHVSEVMPKSDLSSPVDGDWFEITNAGSTPIDIQGFSWDDESREIGKHTVNTSIQLTAGEAIILLEAGTADVPAWLTEWKISNTSVQVLNEGNQFNGFSGLSSGGDEVNLYDDGGRLLSAAAWDGASVNAGVSLVYDTTGTLVGPSVAGTNGAYNSVNGDVGSPGNQNISLSEFLGGEWSLFPNPATEHVLLENATTARKVIRIQSLTGQLLKELSSREPQVRIQVGDLPAGTYLITIAVEGQQATRKLIVQ